MTLSQKKRVSNDRWIKENYRQVKLSMPQSEAEELEHDCSSRKLSKAGFIRAAIKEKMMRDRAKPTPTSSPPDSYPEDEDEIPQDAVSRPIQPFDTSDDDTDTEEYPQSKEEWLAWSVLRESESVDEWRCRLNHALGKFSGINAALWMAAMPKDSLDLLQGFDAESMEQRRKQQEEQRAQELEQSAPIPCPTFCWDDGLSPEQREERLKADRQRFRELDAIRKKRRFTQKEHLEFIHLLTIHKDDKQ